MTIYLTANSPGEVNTWLRPVVSALRSGGVDGAALPQKIVVFLNPCVYATGNEARVAREIDGVVLVIPPWETLRYALVGRRPRAIRQGIRPGGLIESSSGASIGARDPRGALLHLGGEMKLSAWLARRLRVPAYLYTEGFVNSAAAFRRIFVPHRQAADRATRHGAEKEQVEIVGNLMVDATQATWDNQAAAREGLGLPGDAPIVAMLPGSRQHEWETGLPFFTQVIAELRQRVPDLQTVIAVSSFADVLQSAWFPAGESQRWVTVEGGPAMALNNRTADAVRAADIVLTLPGSNTVEVAALGRPMVVAAPLHRPELIPLDGLPGLIGSLPLIGKPIKRAAVLRFSQRVPFIALPNTWAGRQVTPELRGEDLQPWDVTAVAYDLLMQDDVRERIGIELKSVVGSAGASNRIAAALLRAQPIQSRTSRE